MPHFHGPDTPIFPLTAFPEKAARWQNVDRRQASPGLLQMGKLRLWETKGVRGHGALSQSQSFGQTQISGFLTGFLPPSSEVTNGQPVATSTPRCAFFGQGVF